MNYDSYRISRKWTSLLMDAMDNDRLSAREVADMALMWLPEDSVKEMCQQNDLVNLDPEYGTSDEEEVEDEST